MSFTPATIKSITKKNANAGAGATSKELEIEIENYDANNNYSYSVIPNKDANGVPINKNDITNITGTGTFSITNLDPKEDYTIYLETCDKNKKCVKVSAVENAQYTLSLNLPGNVIITPGDTKLKVEFKNPNPTRTYTYNYKCYDANPITIPKLNQVSSPIINNNNDVEFEIAGLTNGNKYIVELQICDNNNCSNFYVSEEIAPSNMQTLLQSVLTQIIQKMSSSTSQRQQPTNSIKKIIPKTPSDQVNILETTDNGNLNEITVLYNALTISEIKITGLTFKIGNNDYSYDGTNVTTNGTPVTDTEIKHACEYLASLNLSFYTDPNSKYTVNV